ncbi:carbohydrate ABC transporter permease [Breznakiella homolactica]|uniref:Carbohydrate ABC transporter permease n=1 Tax=Breznakiella homolactica TaxID=2798577 RepID=A0A7T7XKP8_9SPIR|nr:carbohydrate ABC transporter permease [Breznakiella homolactica]QQO08126.1 carbohydrate ABC transporter permease [Breznakiella homolactica]
MKRKKAIPVYMVVYYIFLCLAVVIVLIPFIWMLSASFDRINSYELPYPPRFIPANPSLFNYQLVIKNLNIIQYMFNTVIVVIISLALQLILAPLAGFAFSKGTFPLKMLLLTLVLSNMMVPIETKILPMYQMIKGMGLSNTYLGIALPAVLTNGFFIFLMKKFCDDLPNELLESGTLDGASRLRIYLQIYLPLMGPGLATLAVLDVMNVWNDLLWPMIVVNKIEMFTIQAGLAMFSSGGDAVAVSKHAGMATAASVLSIIPLALVFIFLQKYIVQSIAVSGIKQ